MTPRTSPILTLPFASTAVAQSPQLLTVGADLVLAVEFIENGLQGPFWLRFRKHRAHRMRAESYCTPWHIESVYDTLCEVASSPWIDELRAAAAPEWRDYWVMKHFMIYVDSFGCLEVVAESAVLEDSSKNAGGT
jgi:hypothetical protein